MGLSIENIISEHDSVLIDFCAVWCEPCKWVGPILDDVDKHYCGKIKIHKIDIDDHADVAKSLHILSVPTLVLFSSGKEVWRMRGFESAAVLIKTLGKHIK